MRSGSPGVGNDDDGAETQEDFKERVQSEDLRVRCERRREKDSKKSLKRECKVKFSVSCERNVAGENVH